MWVDTFKVLFAFGLNVHQVFKILIFSIVSHKEKPFHHIFYKCWLELSGTITVIHPSMHLFNR